MLLLFFGFIQYFNRYFIATPINRTVVFYLGFTEIFVKKYRGTNLFSGKIEICWAVKYIYPQSVVTPFLSNH